MPDIEMAVFEETNERFDVWQFLLGDIQEKVRERVPIKEAVHAAWHYTHNVATIAGITRRVIITDSDDKIAFEWTAEGGVVFPVQEKPASTRREYGK